MAAQLEVIAERKIGQLLPEMIRRPEEGRPKEVCREDIHILEDLGLTLKESSNYQQLAKIPEKEWNKSLVA